MPDVRELARDAYVYGLQQVVFYATRFNYTQHPDGSVFVGVNRWKCVNDGRPIDASFRSVVTPNATTAYAMGFLDLSDGPVVVDMPEVPDRYFSLQVMNHYGVFELYAGSQFNGTRGRSYLFVAEGDTDRIPGSFVTTDIIPVPNRSLCSIVRFARSGAPGESEDARILDLLERTRMTPVDAWVAAGGHEAPGPESPVVEGGYATFARLPEIVDAQVENQTARDFFTLLQLVLDDPTLALVGDSATELEMLDRLTAIGIGPGLGFDWDALDDATRADLDAGFRDGYRTVKSAGMQNLLDMNGWGVIQNAGGFARDWEARAVMADFGWLGPDRNISHGAAFRFADDSGEPLDGAARRYTITFDIENLPPVTEFWEIPIYDADGYFVANEIDRFSVNSYMLQRGELAVVDGTLTLYLQHERPQDPEAVRNWLPSPAGPFRLTPRFYGPAYSLVNGTYPMPAVVRAGG